MATNSNTKQMLYQANSFNKGMDADTTDMLISDESYRLAKNLRYITDAGESTGELRLIEGAEKIGYSREDSDSSDYLSEDYTVRAFNSMRNVGALVCQKEDNSWAVFRMDSNGTEWTTQLIFGWCTDALSQDVKLSTVLKYEDADLLQLYIADGQHQLMKINLYDTTRSSDIRYVTTGKTFSDLQKILITEVLTGGLLEAGLVLYTYRLYNDNNTSSLLAPLSNINAIISLYSEIGPVGLASLTKSSMGLRLKIQIDGPGQIKDLYNKILIYRIHYVVNGQLPKIQLINDSDLYLNGDRFIYDDFGYSSLQELTVEEFNSINGISIHPKLIETKNNYLFAGNIKYDIDIFDDVYLNMDFRAFSSGDRYEGTDDPIDPYHLPTIDQNTINRNLYFTEKYNSSDWISINPIPDGEPEIGGWSYNILWKFGILNEHKINEYLSDKPEKESGDLQIRNDVQRNRDKGLLRDEVYRYGIILYSKNGIKYPTKWIADIRTPDANTSPISEFYIDKERLPWRYFERSRILYPIFNVTASLDKSKISGYEIVRVKRTIADRATVSLGIIASTVLRIDENGKDTQYVSSTGLPFLDHMTYTNNVINHPNRPYEPLPSIRYIATHSVIDGKRSYRLHTDIKTLLFYSPEVSYLSDDIINVLKEYPDAFVQCIYPVVSPICKWLNWTYPVLSATSSGTPTPQRIGIFQGMHKAFLSTVVATNKYFSSEMGYFPIVSVYGPKGTIPKINDEQTEYEWDSRTMDLYYDQDHPYPYDPIEYEDCYSHRVKAYDAYYANVHFDTVDSTRFTNLDGLNVYKLQRSDTSIPSNIHVYSDNSDDEELPNVNTNTKYKILDFALVDGIDPDKLIVEDRFAGTSKLSVVGSYTFYNCIAPWIIGDGTFDISNLKTTSSTNGYRDELIATCDPSLAICLDNDELFDPSSAIQFYYRDENIGRGDTVGQCEYSMLCNIRKNTIPYGGFSRDARNNSTYVGHGYFFNASEAGNEHGIFDGDTTISTFEFTTAHKWYNPTYSALKSTIVCQVPVESTIDIELDHGEKFSNNTLSNPSLVLVLPCDFNNVYIQKSPSYLYNTAYSTDPQLLLNNYSLSQMKKSLTDFDHRVHYSNPASNNQAADPWLIFQPLNYLDVDNSHGPITELRTFKDLLIFWQEKAMGVLSVNERVQIATDSNLPLILGTGGVLERYDYLTTANGMKENQHADTQSDHTLYWWDYDNNTICAYSRGSVPVQLSKVKSVQNILNRAAKDGNLTQSNISTGIYPLLTYDKKYNEVLFKIGQLEKLDKAGIHKGDAGLKDSDNDNVLVYNEQQAQFSSIYEIDPQCYFNIEQKLFFMNRENDRYNMYRWNSGSGEQSLGFNETPLLPYLKYVINNQKGAVKVYDNVEFAGRIPSGDTWDEESQRRSLYMSTLDKHVKFEFNTPLKQVGKIDGTKITNRQLDFKFAIPRNGYQDKEEWITKEYGDRMRGKTMQCEIYSDINSLDFSLLYILTKYRMSWG